MPGPEESQVDSIEALECDDETSAGNFLAAVNGIRSVRDQLTGYVDPDEEFLNKENSH